MIIDQLRENVLGLPWRQPRPQSSEERGYGDLIFIVTGHHYAIACDLIHDKDTCIAR